MPCDSDADMDDWLWGSSQLQVSWVQALTNPGLLESMVRHLSKGADCPARLTFVRGGSSIRCKPVEPVLLQKSIGLADLCLLVRRVDRAHGLRDWRFMLLKAHTEEDATPTVVEQDLLFYQQWPPFTLNTGMLGVRKHAVVYGLPVHGWRADADVQLRNLFLGFMKFKAVKDFRKNKSKNDLLMVLDPLDPSMSSHSFHALLKGMTRTWNQGPMNVGLSMLDHSVSDAWTGLIKKLWSTTGYQMYQNHDIRLAQPSLAWIDHLLAYQSQRVYQNDHFVSERTAAFDASLFPQDLMDQAKLSWEDEWPCGLPNKAAKTGMNWLVLDVHSP